MNQTLPLKSLIVLAAAGGAFLLGRGLGDDAPTAEPADAPPAAAAHAAGFPAEALAQLPPELRQQLQALMARQAGNGANEVAKGERQGRNRRVAGQRQARNARRGAQAPAWSSASGAWLDVEQPVWPLDGDDTFDMDLEAFMAQFELQGQADMQAAQVDMAALSEAWAALALLGYGGQQAGGFDLGALGSTGGGSPADPWLSGGQIDGNWLTGTAISTSGDSGYIALGDGGFVSW